jgi:hypothetical protein
MQMASRKDLLRNSGARRKQSLKRSKKGLISEIIKPVGQIITDW